MKRELPFLSKPLIQVFIRTTDIEKNESTIYGNFGEFDENRIVRPLQVINYVYEELFTDEKAIEAFRFWDNKKGKTYAEINVILEGLKACNTSMYGFIIKQLMEQIEELDRYIEAENNVSQVIPMNLNKKTLRIGQLRETIKKLEEAIIILANDF